MARLLSTRVHIHTLLDERSFFCFTVTLVLVWLRAFDVPRHIPRLRVSFDSVTSVPLFIALNCISWVPRQLHEVEACLYPGPMDGHDDVDVDQ